MNFICILNLSQCLIILILDFSSEKSCFFIEKFLLESIKLLLADFSIAIRINLIKVFLNLFICNAGS